MKKVAFDLLGEKFGKLTVIKRVENRNNKSWWLCKCDCGNEKEVLGSYLVHGRVSSCGCSHYDKISTHKLSRTPLYQVWRDMKKRCYSPKCKSFSNYGGRGIKVCDEWVNDFDTFSKWALNNGYSSELTIDRINNDGDYCPDNCRWVSRQEQNRNTRRNHHITYMNETHTLAEWCRKLDVNYYTALARIYRGCTSAEMILSKERWK